MTRNVSMRQSEGGRVAPTPICRLCVCDAVHRRCLRGAEAEDHRLDKQGRGIFSQARGVSLVFTVKFRQSAGLLAARAPPSAPSSVQQWEELGQPPGTAPSWDMTTRTNGFGAA